MKRIILSFFLSGVFHCMVFADVLIDVRSREEYDAGHIEGALSVEYSVIQDHIGGIAKNKSEKIYLYCRSGRRSGIALQTLKSMGYTDVVNLGGFSEAREAWRKIKPGD